MEGLGGARGRLGFLVGLGDSSNEGFRFIHELTDLSEEELGSKASYLPVPNQFAGMAAPKTEAEGKSLAISFSDCGNNAHSVVTSVTPNTLPLGGQTCFTGKGTNNFATTSASWTI